MQTFSGKAFPIQTTNSGEKIVGAENVIDFLKKAVFSECAERALFKMNNGKGVDYEGEYRYVRILPSVVNTLLSMSMVKKLKGFDENNGSNFLLLKKSTSGRNFIMLYQEETNG